MKLVSGGQKDARLHPAKSAGAYSEQSANVLAGILESVDDLFAALDAELRFVAFNAALRRAFTAVFGHAPALGQHLRDALAGYVDEAAVIQLGQRTLAGEAFTIEQDLTGPDDLYKLYQIHVTPILNTEGKAVVIALMARDVTEQREAERKFQQLLDASPDAMLIARDGLIEYINPQAEAMFGYAPGGLLGKSLESLVPQHLHEQHRRDRAAYERHPRTRRMGIGMDLRGVRADGTEFPVEISLSPITVAGQTMVAAAIRDVSLRKQAEAALRQENAELKLQVAQQDTQLHDMQQHELAEAKASAHYREIFEQGAAGIAVTAIDGRFLQTNEAMCDITGYAREELQSLRVHDITHPDDVDMDRKLDAQLLAGRRSSYTLEKRLRHKDGRVIWCAVAVSLKRDAHGTPQHFTIVIEDITQRKATDQKFADSHVRLQMTVELAQLGFWERDVATNETYYSPEWKQQIGYGDAELPSTYHEWNVRLHPDDHQPVLEQLQRFIDQPQGELQIEYRFRHRDGGYRWFRSRIIALEDPPGKTRKLIGVRLDITEHKEAEQNIRHTGQHDVLTGLPNRGLLFEYGGHILAAARRSGTPGAVLFIDLDRFKDINDTYGHEAGDAVLREVARRLVTSIRKGDIAGRLSGDEFLVILPQVSDDLRATSIAKHMLARLNQSHRIGEREVAITPSIGVSMFPTNSDDLDTLVRQADRAMYMAKARGRSRIQVFTPELARRAEDAQALENRLKAALRQNEFELHFLAMARSDTAEVIGAEALLRWCPRSGKPVPPGKFIPIVEAGGLIGELGEWVLRIACEQQVQWRRDGLPALRMAVNISSAHFRHAAFGAALARAIRTSGIDPAWVQIEVAEATVMQDLDKAIAVLHEVHRMGVRIALDNFGVGNCGLGALARLPVDTLKIDTSFVRKIEAERNSEAVTHAAIALGRILNLEMVAEGVESQEALDYVRAHQCQLVQGFHVGKPMPAGEFKRWFAQNGA